MKSVLQAAFLMGLCGLAPGQTLRPAADGDRSIAAGITAPVAADFNNDGHPDLAVHGVTDIKIYLGNGDGTFSPPAVTPLGGSETRILYHAATAGDFNHDGKVDLIAYGRYFEGNGDGSLTYAGPSVLVHHLETLDSYEDSAWGVAGFTIDGAYGISLGTKPNETLGAVDAPYAAPWFLYEEDVAYGIVATGGAPATGPAPGTVGRPPTLYCVGNQCASVAFLGNQVGLGSPLKLVVFASKSGPGNLHVGLVGTGGLRVFHLLGGLGVFNIAGAEEVQTRPSAGILNDVAFLDVDGGPRDLLVAQVDGSTASIGYYSGIGGGFAPFTPLYTFPVTDSNVTLTVGDWNQDGRLDFVTQDGESVRLYLRQPAVYAVSSATAEARIAPGALATIYGRNLAPDALAAPSLAALPTALGGIRVRIDEGETSYDAELLFVSPSQINFRVHPESRTGSLRGQVLGGAGTVDFSLSVDPEAPGLFTSDGTHAVASVSSSSSTWDVLLYATGLNGAPASETSVLLNGKTLQPESVAQMREVTGLDLVRVSIPKSSCAPDACTNPEVVLKVRESLSSGALLKLNSSN